MTNWLLTWLLNALWQVPLIYCAARIAARLLRPAGPLAEHRVWVTAAVLQVLLPACSGGPLAWIQALRRHIAPREQTAGITVAFGQTQRHVGLHIPPAIGHALLVIWTLVLLFHCLRLLGAFHSVRMLRRTAKALELSAQQDELWRNCRRQFHLSGVQIATSESLTTPITLGVRRPVIFLPAALLSTLEPDYFQIILLHESAHIVRHDSAWNLALQLITAPTRFHPFTALTLGRLTQSREIVCDMLAAEALHDPSSNGRVRYARSLLSLASTLAENGRRVNSYPLGIGIFDAQTLERRIMHLTQTEPQPALLRRLMLTAAALTFACLTATGALALRTAVAPADPVHVASGIMAGDVLSKVAPKYPQAAKDAGIQGTVVLHAIIGKDGVIDRLTVLSGPPELTTSALDAVRHWTYKPYTLNGQPTEVETTITVNYTLAP